MRQFLRDRLSAGAIVAMITYVLLLQGVVTGFAQGEMMRQLGDPLAVICSSDTGVTPSNPADSSSTKHVQCPCATLCHLVVANNPATPSAIPAPAYDALAGLKIRFAARPAFPVPDFHRYLAEARAPPILSL